MQQQILPDNIFTRLNTGDLLDLMHPELTNFRMDMVARALSNICRFAGQVKPGTFYSVAEHSVYVSLLAEELGGDPWQALWHDASEGLGMNDVVSPLKSVLHLYNHIEDGVMAEVGKQFRFPWPKTDEVDLADRLMCQVEGRAIVPGWRYDVPSEHFERLQRKAPVCLVPELAYQLFIMRLKAVAAVVKPFPRLELLGA